LSVFGGLGAGKDRAWERPGIRAIKGDEDLLRALWCVLRTCQAFSFSWPFRLILAGIFWGSLLTSVCCHQVAGVGDLVQAKRARRSLLDSKG